MSTLIFLTNLWVECEHMNDKNFTQNWIVGIYIIKEKCYFVRIFYVRKRRKNPSL
jgi:hypothetical protein